MLAAILAAALRGPLAMAQGAAAGDAAKGRDKTQMCQGCHGIDGWRTAYPEVYRVPKIGGQHEAYLAEGAAGIQERRAQPSVDARDRGVALGPGHGRSRRVLRAERRQDGGEVMRDVEHSQRSSPRSRACGTAGVRRRPRRRQGEGHRSVRGLPRRGRQQHEPDFPKLGGQYRDYLAKALRDYKSGDRKNAIMAGFAKPLSKEDIDNLAAYYAAQPAVVSSRH